MSTIYELNNHIYMKIDHLLFDGGDEETTESADNQPVEGTEATSDSRIPFLVDEQEEML